MLLLTLLLPPLAAYLMVLGRINRRPRPVLVAGTWDFMGVLFALSGFFLFGGPALLDALEERSRWFWLLGPADPRWPWPGGQVALWVGLRLFYFLAVAAAASVGLWRGRRLTAVYNVDLPSVVSALEATLRRLGLEFRRKGDSFLVGDAALRVDVFPPMRHATLRWEPSDSPVRSEVEKGLETALAPAPEPAPLVGGCLAVFGVLLFLVAFLAGGLLLLVRLYPLR